MRSAPATLLYGASILGAVALLDYVTPADVDFELFYIVPVVFVAWLVGWRLGITFAVLATAVQFVVDLSLRRPTPGALVWNEISRTAILALAAVGVDRLRVERDRLARIIADRDTLIGLLEREFPRPLRALDWYGRTFAEVLSLKLNQNERKHMAALRNHIRQVAFLAGDLLAIGNLQAGRLRFQREPIDIAQTVIEVAAESEDRGRVILGSGMETLLVQADGDALRHALASVVSHALGASQSEPVTILVRPSDHYGVIEVDCRATVTEDDLELARLLVAGLGGRVTLALSPTATSIVSIALERAAEPTPLTATG
jgi:hypothetical protein